LENYKIFQIYYDAATERNCVPEFTKFPNSSLSAFFENEIIQMLGSVQYPGKSKYFGVLSHSFFVKNTILPSAIISNLDAGEYDVYCFSGGLKIKNVIDTAENYHPGFRRAMELIVQAIGYDVDLSEPTRMVCYQNAFVAKSEIYQDYIDTLLAPAMKVMDDLRFNELQAIIWKDSNYHRRRDPDIRARLMRYIGVDYYPYHTFICERLFTLYMQKNKNLTFKHLC
jgi:hypothetical protein